MARRQGEITKGQRQAEIGPAHIAEFNAGGPRTSNMSSSACARTALRSRTREAEHRITRELGYRGR